MSVNAQRLIAFLCFSQTLFLASTFRTWEAVGVVAFVAGVVIWMRNRRISRDQQETPSRLPNWIRNSLLAILFCVIVGVAAAWRWASQVGESINPIYVAVDVLAHAAFFSSLVVWSLRPHRGHVSMLPLGLFVVLLCVAAGGASQSIAAQTTVALSACLGFTLASQVILGAQQGGGSIFVYDRSERGTTNWLGPLFSMLTLSVLMMATSAIGNATNYVLPGIQEQLQQQLQARFDAVADQSTIGGTRYVRGSTLGVIRRHMMGEPNEIALRIHADVAPGYLRGHAFDLYRRRQWFPAGGSRDFSDVASIQDRVFAPSAAGTTILSEPLNRALTRFGLVEQANDRTINLEIHNDPLKGQLVFLPLTTRWLEARSSELVVTHHGIVRLGVDVTKPYIAGVGLFSLREQLDPDRREVLLQVPDSIAREVNRVADQVCAQSTTSTAKATAISQFFQQQFTYSLNSTKPPRRRDPLGYFLETKHGAHCEYFASATVMILRSAGVPARYVTGYVADEFVEDEEMWVARNGDAHAWAEAYDDVSERWFPVESTPGRTYRTVDPNETIEEADSFFDVFGRDDDDDSDSLLSQVLGWLLSTRVTDPLLFVFRVAQLPLFFVVVYLLWSRYLKPSRSELDPIDLQSRKMLRKVDRLLRKYALVRLPSETPYQFADRIEVRRCDPETPISRDADKQLSAISRWYREYADARYQGKLPSPLV